MTVLLSLPICTATALLLRHTNEAVAAYGHGTLRREDGASLEIGGSTQGVTRFLLDGCAEPDVESFLAGS